MNFPIFELINSVSLEKFIQFWSKYYLYKNEDLYIDHINKTKLISDDVYKLFLWKNGVRLSRQKARLVNKIVSKIDIINKLKTSFDKDLFDKEFSFIKGAIWKIFLLHVINKDRFPIFDQFVYYACNFLKDGVMSKMPVSNDTKELFYYKIYINFFEDLIAFGADRKKLDEALWAFGKFLKSPYGAQL